jgi:lactate 2-monooxygenase
MDQTAVDWQKEIYLNGFAGIRPKVPIDFAKLEAKAKRCMSSQALERMLLV